MSRTILLLVFVSSLVLSGCSTSTVKQEQSEYLSYDCPRLFEAMEYKVGEANMLFVNPEDEDSVGKMGSGALTSAAGAALASSLILTPVGWVLAGGLMLSGAGQMVDGLAHEELSDEEKSRMVQYKNEYNEMREAALAQKCDYYGIPKWDVSTK